MSEKLNYKVGQYQRIYVCDVRLITVGSVFASLLTSLTKVTARVAAGNGALFSLRNMWSVGHLDLASPRVASSVFLLSV